MNNYSIELTRRDFILGMGAFSAAMVLFPRDLIGKSHQAIQRPIPSSGELLSVMGMGTSRTFDIEDDPVAQNQLAEVVRIFFEKGGRVIDSSPMYGRSESVVGDLLKATGKKNSVFAATKVWTDGRQNGIAQMQDSFKRMGVEVMDLMQIHNLRDWQTHLQVLKEWKQKGLIRYIGITTSHGRDHEALEEIMKKEDLDFVQFTYNLEDRIVEKSLLPLASDRGIATLINRPFQRGDLFRKIRGKNLPDWSAEFDCTSWGQYFLKFILAHPAVTCVIPATSKVHHMKDNMGAGFGRLPDEAMRQRMIAHYDSL